MSAKWQLKEYVLGFSGCILCAKLSQVVNANVHVLGVGRELEAECHTAAAHLSLQVVGVGCKVLGLLGALGGEAGHCAAFVHGHQLYIGCGGVALIVAGHLGESHCGECGCGGLIGGLHIHEGGKVESVGNVDYLHHRLVVNHIGCHHE